MVSEQVKKTEAKREMYDNCEVKKTKEYKKCENCTNICIMQM